ncbi:Uncharacterised protein [Vibrio cholerae]|nr:Uncharacterised protein [Vibrio cholerae]CSI52933.1 Uncharacterised protein [Vibrio cholerae]CSI79298.1 Uncharacterised protein [Vibrio cholerae]
MAFIKLRLQHFGAFTPIVADVVGTGVSVHHIHHLRCDTAQYRWV